MAVIPYGIDHQVFCAPERARRAVPTVGLTYSVVYNKGSDISLQAYRLARESVPDLRLIVTGAHRDYPRTTYTGGRARGVVAER